MFALMSPGNAGQRFGKYVLGERIAAGGMAEVFRAVAEGPAGVEKTVALKRVLPMLSGAGEFVTMFIDEARIAASLTHVNIAQVFEFGEVEGAYYLAMELVEGADLGRLAEAARKAGRKLPWPMIAFLIAEAARGLAYAHDKRGRDGQPLGIVHRDVSPQNILVSRAGEVKLADFGIAKAIGKLHKTESGAVMGKLRYMSPEQVLGEPLDGRSDLFALGIVLWELLCGRTLFDGDHPGRVAEQVKQAEVPPPSKFAPGVPAELERIACKCLARARDGRYAKAVDLARELSVFVSEKAPGLGRDEVGALVQELLPGDEAARPRTTGKMETATEVGHAPTVAVSPANANVDANVNVNVNATTRPERRKAARFPLALAALAMAPLAALVAWKLAQITQPAPSEAAVPPSAAVDAAPGPTMTAPATPRLAEADRARLLSELKALPQESATRRGVAVEDYLALLSAVDGALCASGDAAQPTFPPDAVARLQPLRLEPEARALARYVLAAGEPPPEVTGPLRAFLSRSPAFSLGPPSWAMGALAFALESTPAHTLDLMRENSALHRWRDRAVDAPAPTGFAALCDRASLVDRYVQAAPGPRAEGLRRFLAATPPDAAMNVEGLRLQVTGAARDEAAATLEVRLRVTNPGADEKSLGLLSQARLFGSTAAPTIDPPAVALPGGATRELKLTFPRFGDEAAEVAVLVVGPGRELAAYSELLR
jgi:serine/threonine protein kinase